MGNVSLVDGHIDEPKMTDEEIIKALPMVAYGGHFCNKCKYKYEKGECRCGLKGCRITRNALDLINRLQAKNKELDDKLVIHKGTIDWQAKEINRQKAEIERLRKEHRLNLLTQLPIARKIKAEAIKEFAHLLIDKAKKGVIYAMDIPDYVKEMVGD